ncbi:hypothetical protein MRB53_029058 [Persea americana]|uniref:Uncharacterized protein n=1 Tax=Persea americana TaxID=3435 RepID=A0ACC2KHD5_PERAE|nr:hypothetical protein MRB53_029058 [Persea americana]
MRVTRADLSVERRSADLGVNSKLGAFFIVFSVLCSISCFTLCVVVEAIQSEASWVVLKEEKDAQTYECAHRGNARSILFCALGASVALAIAMVTKHVYILIAIYIRPTPPALISWASGSAISRAFRWQAAFFFASTWLSFLVAELLLTTGISIEMSNLKKWSETRPKNCLVVQEGLFATAGIFGLATPFLAAGVYLTALHAQRLHQEEENVNREMMEASYLYSSPVRVRTDWNQG